MSATGSGSKDSDATSVHGGGYSDQLDTLRSVAKWLVAAFAGVGALLVAGLSISGLSELPTSSWRFYVSVCAAAVALVAVGFMIREASVVLTHEWLSLASFGDEPAGKLLSAREKPSRDDRWRQAQLEEIDELLTLARHELFGYAASTRADLHRRLSEADERIISAKPESAEARKELLYAAMLRGAARDTAQYANYYFTLKLFGRMRRRLAIAALIVAVSIGVYAYAIRLPGPSLRVQLVSMASFWVP